MNPVKLSEIADGIESQNDEISFYLNKKTGAVVMITEEDRSAANRIDEDGDSLEDFDDWQHEAIKAAIEINDNSDDYLDLPSRYEVNEYKIMENFCDSIEDENLQEKFFIAINGKGAFRRFKDTAYRHDLLDNWYEFKMQALKKKAIEWCEENDINYTE